MIFSADKQIPLLVGDSIGIAVGTPLTLRFLLHPRDEARALAEHLPSFVGFAVTVLGMLWLILGIEGRGDLGHHRRRYRSPINR